jgi:Flp pilus assembly CpaF family ATPase
MWFCLYPDNEQIVTIEDTELQLKQKHVLRLEKRPRMSKGTER